MTAAVETAGLVIFCVWIIQPIREFAGIFQAIRNRRAPAPVKQFTIPREKEAAPAVKPSVHRELVQTRS